MSAFTQTIAEEKLSEAAAMAIAIDEPAVASMVYILLESMGYKQEVPLVAIMNLYNQNILRKERKEIQRNSQKLVVFQEPQNIYNDIQIIDASIRKISDAQNLVLQSLSKVQNTCLDNSLIHIGIAIAIIIQSVTNNQETKLADIMYMYNQDSLKPAREEATADERENWRVA